MSQSPEPPGASAQEDPADGSASPAPDPSASPATPPKPPKQQPDKGERWRETGQVVKVLDGDTFDLQTVGGVQRVRINGIQAPEKRWCGGPQARAALAAALPEGTTVWLSSRKAASGNAPYGVWRVKRTVHVEVEGQWVDIAPDLLRRGLVFPFPFIGETVHNEAYLDLARAASKARVGLYDPELCGPEPDESARLRLEVLPGGPGGDEANSEFVMVFNGGSQAVDLAGWMVQDTSPLNAFFFPKGAQLAPDDYVVVYSGEGTRGVAPDGSKDPRFFYAGTGSRWNNDTTDIAFLFDDAGKRRTGNLRSWRILEPDR
jgi:micrococcal nuclease